MLNTFKYGALVILKICHYDFRYTF